MGRRENQLVMNNAEKAEVLNGCFFGVLFFFCLSLCKQNLLPKYVLGLKGR